MGDSPPDKLFYKIGEVAELLGVKTHVLRYWETEFPAVRPMKTRGSHRVYRRRDVELLRRIQVLLHQEGYTIPGARKKLKENKPAEELSLELRGELLSIRKSLSTLLVALDRESQAAEQPPRQVKIEKVIERPSLRSRRPSGGLPSSGFPDARSRERKDD